MKMKDNHSHTQTGVRMPKSSLQGQCDLTGLAYQWHVAFWGHFAHCFTNFRVVLLFFATSILIFRMEFQIS